MDLYLIRHGETVDNVAGLWAGIRDSALTNHGVEQTQRLGAWFAKGMHSVRFSHIFASPLSRALRTAQAIRNAQLAAFGTAEGVQLEDASSLQITEDPDLIEQNFGSMEGVSFSARHAASKTSNSTPAESKVAMAQRVNDFLDRHIVPLLIEKEAEREQPVVAVVSHGILLSQLWKQLLNRLPPNSVAVIDHALAGKGDGLVLEHLCHLSNTGILHVRFDRTATNMAAIGPWHRPRLEPFGEKDTQPAHTEANSASLMKVVAISPSKPTNGTSSRILNGWTASILSVNGKAHLSGLKRQRGGIGSLAHDAKQQKVDGFFKRMRSNEP